MSESTDKSNNEAKDKEPLKENTESKIEKEVSPEDLEIDVASDQFNPIRLLYTENIRISKKPPKTHYQNLAAFESALKKNGIWGLQQAPNRRSESEATSSKSRKNVVEEAKEVRRFLPHQMPIKATPGSGVRQRHFKNLWKGMDKMLGPLSVLSESVKMQWRVRVVVRNEHGVRGHIEGNVVCFDKHWNVVLSNVLEVWRRRKYKYGVNKICEAGNAAVDCSQRLAELGIILPQQSMKSLNRKNVEITRSLEKLMVRGEQIVLVNILTKKRTEKLNNNTLKESSKDYT